MTFKSKLTLTKIHTSSHTLRHTSIHICTGGAHFMIVSPNRSENYTLEHIYIQQSAIDCRIDKDTVRRGWNFSSQLLRYWPQCASSRETYCYFIHIQIFIFSHSYFAAHVCLLRVTVPLRVLWGYTACLLASQASVTVHSSVRIPRNTLNGTVTRSSHCGTA